MNSILLEKKIDSLIEDLKSCMESDTLSEKDMTTLNAEIDKLLYECLYYKSKLVC